MYVVFLSLLVSNLELQSLFWLPIRLTCEAATAVNMMITHFGKALSIQDLALRQFQGAFTLWQDTV